MAFCGSCFVHDLTPLPLRVNHTRSPVRSATPACSLPKGRLLEQSLATTSEHVNVKTSCCSGPRFSQRKWNKPVF